MISFSNHAWRVRSTDERSGPCMNLFSPTGPYVDQEGLHLRILETPRGWEASEVVSARRFGHGTYRFAVDTHIEQLDLHVALGLFAYERDDREIDIEFARWDHSLPPEMQMVVQPWAVPGHLRRVPIPPGFSLPVMHEFTWLKDRVVFRTFNGSHNWECAASPPPGNSRVHMNLYLFREGKHHLPAPPPTDLRPVEVVIKRFEFRAA